MQKLTALCERYGIRDDVNLRMLILNQKEATYFADEFEKVHSKLQKYAEGKLRLHLSRKSDKCDCEGECGCKEGKPGVISLWPFRDMHPKIFKGLEITLLAAMYYYALESFLDDELHDRLWDVCMKIERNTLKFARRNINNHQVVVGKNCALVNDLRAILLSCGLIEKSEHDIFDPEFEYDNMTWDMMRGIMPAGSRLKFYTAKELTADCFKYIDAEYEESEIEMLTRTFDGSMGIVYEAYQRCVLTKKLKDIEDELKQVNSILKSKNKTEEKLNKQVKKVTYESQVLKNRNSELAKAKDDEYKIKIDSLKGELSTVKKNNTSLLHENDNLKSQVLDLQQKLSKCVSEGHFHDFLNEIVEKEVAEEEKGTGSEVDMTELAVELKGYRVVVLGGHERWRMVAKEKLDSAQIHNVFVDGYKIKRNLNDIVIYNICSMGHADFDKLRASSEFTKMYFIASKGVSRFGAVIKECLDRHLSFVE